MQLCISSCKTTFDQDILQLLVIFAQMTGVYQYLNNKYVDNAGPITYILKS